MQGIELPVAPDDDVEESWCEYAATLARALQRIDAWAAEHTARLCAAMPPVTAHLPDPATVSLAAAKNALIPLTTQQWWRDTAEPPDAAAPQYNSDAENDFFAQCTALALPAVDYPDWQPTPTHYPGTPPPALYALHLPYAAHARFGVVVLRALHVLHLYYLDHMGAAGGQKRWTTVWPYGSGSGRMSFHALVFLAIMQLRVVRRLTVEVDHGRPRPSGSAYACLAPCRAHFPWVRQQMLALENTYPIAAMSQSELDQLLTNVMFKMARVPWHEELHHYIHALADRLAVLFVSPQPRTIMDIATLSALAPPALAGNGGPAMYTFNMDFLYRCAWRYYYAIQNLIGYEQMLRSDHVPLQPLIYPNGEPPGTRYARTHVDRLAKHLRALLFATRLGQFSPSEKNTIVEQLRDQVVRACVPQGDREWCHYRYPMVGEAAKDIMTHLHPSVFNALKAELFPVAGHAVLKHYAAAEETSAVFVAQQLLALLLFDKQLVHKLASFAFRERFVVAQDDGHRAHALLDNTHLPLLRQWMGRFYLTFNNATSTENPTLFHALAEWMLVAYHYCRDDLWPSFCQFAPADMRPSDLFPPSADDDTDAAQPENNTTVYYLS